MKILQPTAPTCLKYFLVLMFSDQNICALLMFPIAFCMSFPPHTTSLQHLCYVNMSSSALCSHSPLILHAHRVKG